MLQRYCFDLHLQTHIAELGPIPDGGNLTILKMWEQAGLLPPNKVNELSYWESVVTHTVLPVKYSWMFSCQRRSLLSKL